MSVPSIPQTYTVTVTSAGQVFDVGLDDIRVTSLPATLPTVTTDIKVTELPPSLPKVSTEVSGGLDVGLANIHIKELPRMDVSLAFEPMRVHLPSHYELCFSGSLAEFMGKRAVEKAAP
jgi:hypothetical protein